MADGIMPLPECTSDVVSQTIAGSDIAVNCCDSVDGINGSRPECARGMTYSEAESHCASNGMFLCSQQQLYDGNWFNKGCSFSTRMVWTRTPCNSLGYIPTSNPTLSPTKLPTLMPSLQHTLYPSISPTNHPSGIPTNNPTTPSPTVFPTMPPTANSEVTISGPTTTTISIDEEANSTSNDVFDTVFMMVVIASAAVVITLCCVCLGFVCAQYIKQNKQRYVLKNVSEMIQMERKHIAHSPSIASTLAPITPDSNVQHQASIATDLMDTDLMSMKRIESVQPQLARFISEDLYSEESEESVIGGLFTSTTGSTATCQDV